jgi:hypothetical protein
MQGQEEIHAAARFTLLKEIPCERSRRLSENGPLSFRTERSEERNLGKSMNYDEQDFSLPLEMTVLGQRPSASLPWPLWPVPFGRPSILDTKWCATSKVGPVESGDYFQRAASIRIEHNSISYLTVS